MRGLRRSFGIIPDEIGIWVLRGVLQFHYPNPSEDGGFLKQIEHFNIQHPFISVIYTLHLTRIFSPISHPVFAAKCGEARKNFQ